MTEGDLLARLARVGAVPLASLTDEELASIRADEGTPFRPAEPPESMRALPDEARRAVLTTALRGLVARGLVRQPTDEELERAPEGGRLDLQALGDLDPILAIRRAPTAVAFVGQASYLAALHGFAEGGAAGFLEERIDGRGFHHFTLRTVDGAVEELARVADPRGLTPTALPAASAPAREIPDELAAALRELAPGVTRVDAYHVRPAGTRRSQLSIVVGREGTAVVSSAFGVAPEPPQVAHVDAAGLRDALRAVLRDSDPSADAEPPDDPELAAPADGYRCPVCGYPGLAEPPYAEVGGASYETCPSCGFEFGFHDESEGISFETWRAQWVAGGMRWRSRGVKPPPGWDPAAQLRTLEEG